MQDTTQEWYQDLPVSGRKAAFWGFSFLFIVAATFGVWAITAPIDSAVIADGTMVARGKNQVVQHLEGGIIDSIHVEEGDSVEKSQVLITLDATKSAAEAQRLVERRKQLLALQYRLRWETSVLLEPKKIARGKFLSIKDFPKPAQPEWQNDPEARKYLAEQKKELFAGMQHRRNEILRLEKQVSGQEKSIERNKSVLIAKKEEKDSVGRTYKTFQQLWTKRLVRKSDLESLRGRLASIEASEGEFEEKIALAEEKVEELKKAIQSVSYRAREERLRELRQANDEYTDVHERAIAALDVAQRNEILSPVDGIVVQVNPNTKGGVIRSGDNLMEILPRDKKLIVRANIRPTDIDNIKVGQTVTTQLSGLNQRLVPMIPGFVENISADLIRGDRPEDNVYYAKIKLDTKEFNDIKALKIVPGMPVTVFIKTGEQTFWDYLLKPLQDSFRRAFREGGGDDA